MKIGIQSGEMVIHKKVWNHVCVAVIGFNVWKNQKIIKYCEQS